jgi:molybdopterin-guanine dinucleotide biosynthesis protein A
MMKPSYTGIILAGGENKRFNGNEKAFIQINGHAIISHLIQTFHNLFDDIIVVTNSPVPFLDWDVRIVKDIFPVRSSLTGIHAGLFYIQTPYAFIAACDTPFLHQSLVKRILQTIQPEDDVIIPRTQAGYEPLCAVYSKRCLPLIHHKLSQNRLKIETFFNKVRVKTISEKVIKEVDPDLLSFFNINTPEDLQKASVLFNEKNRGVPHGP